MHGLARCGPRPRRSLVVGACFAASLFGAAAPARGQSLDSEPSDVAGNRAQPAYDAIGIRVGNIMVRPTLTVSPEYSSNIFADPDISRSDLAVGITPAITAAIVAPGASLSLYGEAKFRRYARYSSQDDEQYRIELNGSTELPEDFTLQTGLSWGETTAARGTVGNDLTVGDPLKQRDLRTRVALRKNFNRLYAGASFSATRSTYGDVQLGNGAAIDQSFRNGQQAGGEVSLGYEMSPLLAVEAQARYEIYDYRDARPLSNRDAKGYSLAAGLRYQITQLLLAQFNVGLREHDFDNPLFARIRGVSLSGRLRWYPTPLISLRADLDQSTTTSALDQVSAVTVTDLKAGVDYEYRRNILLTLESGISFEDYGEIGATAKRFSVTGRTEWKINRWLRLGGYASFNSRTGANSMLIRGYSSVQTGVRISFAV